MKNARLVGAIILALNLGCVRVNLPPPVFNSKIQTVNKVIKCPKPDEIESRITKEGIKNIIIGHSSFTIENGYHGNIISLSYELQSYDPNSKYDEKLGLTNPVDIAKLLERKDVKRINIYDKGKDGKPLKEPSITVVKSLQIAEDIEVNYIGTYPYKTSNINDSSNTPVCTFQPLDSKVVYKNIDYVVKRRYIEEIHDKMKENGIMPRIPKVPLESPPFQHIKM